MHRPFPPTVALLACALSVIAFGQLPAASQVATPQAGAAATPAASPVTCVVAPGRLVAVPNAVTIHLTDDGFDPARIQATNNTDFELTLINTGTRPHTFVLPAFDLRLELAPGERVTRTLTLVDRNGAVSHDFYSDAPGDACMRGKLIFYI